MPKHFQIPGVAYVGFSSVVNKQGRTSIPRRVWKELQLKPGSQARWNVYSPIGLENQPRLADLAVFLAMTKRYETRGLFDEQFVDAVVEQLTLLALRLGETPMTVAEPGDE